MVPAKCNFKLMRDFSSPKKHHLFSFVPVVGSGSRYSTQHLQGENTSFQLSLQADELGRYSHHDSSPQFLRHTRLAYEFLVDWSEGCSNSTSKYSKSQTSIQIPIKWRKKHHSKQWIQTSQTMHQKLLNDPHQFSLQSYHEVMVHQNTRGSFMECTPSCWVVIWAPIPWRNLRHLLASTKYCKPTQKCRFLRGGVCDSPNLP